MNHLHCLEHQLYSQQANFGRLREYSCAQDTAELIAVKGMDTFLLSWAVSSEVSSAFLHLYLPPWLIGLS